MNNPYTWNSITLDLFYGRQALINEMINKLCKHPKSSFGIAGGRRMGKTTLLRRIEEELQPTEEQGLANGHLIVPIYVDMLALPRPLLATHIWEDILLQLQAYLPALQWAENQPLNFYTFKRVVKKALKSSSQRCRFVVMFDEIEPIVVCDWGDGFLANWRSLLSNTPKLSEHITAVFAGAQEMSALQRGPASPLRNVLEWRNLQALEYESACQLMQDPIQITWPESFLQQTYRETGGHPMLLQYVMQHVCQLPSERAEQSLEEAIAKFSRQQHWQFRTWWTRYTTAVAQRIYARLPDDGQTQSLRTLTREFGTDETAEALEVLQHLGLIVEEDDGFAFRYAGEMFRRWYRAYGTVENAPLHDPILLERLANIHPELGQKYLSAWGIYQTDLPNYSGATGEIRDVLTQLLHQLAPNELVQAQPGFKFARDQKKPSRRQRVEYIARQRHSKKARRKEIMSDYSLFETEVELLAKVVSSAYGTLSGMTHKTATRSRAYRALKQMDSILAQLVDDSS